MIVQVRRGLRDGEQGWAAVELVLVTPLLVLVFLVVVAFGLLADARLVVADAAHQAARAASLARTEKEARAQAEGAVGAALREAGASCTPTTSAHPGIRKERAAHAAAASADRFYVLRSYLFCALCDHRMYGKDSKGRSYYACQPKKDQHRDAAWYASHPKAVWISERIMLEAVHAFFEDRVFGPQRRDLLEAATATAPGATVTDRSADIQRLQNEADSLARRKELLLDQLASPDEDDGDPETAADFRRGIRRRFDALERKRRKALAQMEQYRTESASSDGPGDVELIEAIPQLSFRFAQLSDALKREIFDAFQLRVRYDGHDRGVQLQATILGAVSPDLAQIAERAAVAAGAADQPIRERPRQDSNLRPSA